MINRIHSWIYRPERGWDPVPSEHSKIYAAGEWNADTEQIVKSISQSIGGLEGKRVLDLGGGPGQFSVAFARQGASVVWHDISRNYQNIAEHKAKEHDVNIEFSLGYLEDAKKYIDKPFDLVFCRICWCYCIDDSKFAKLVYGLVSPGGYAFIDTNNSTFKPARGFRRVCSLINHYVGFKIGHPHPPRGRIAKLFQRYPIEMMIIDYSMSTNDRILFKKTMDT